MGLRIEMSDLRDYFAAHASSEEIKILMADMTPEEWETILGMPRPANHSRERAIWNANVMAACRYLVADAMIYERIRK